jgi:hypothetical protein
MLGEGLGWEREMLWRESRRPNILSSDEIRVVTAGRSGGARVRWAHQDSNLGPSDYESDALTN